MKGVLPYMGAESVEDSGVEHQGDQEGQQEDTAEHQSTVSHCNGLYCTALDCAEQCTLHCTVHCPVHSAPQ